MPLLSKDGRIIGTFGISRDVTESRLMREALIESETRLASASGELTTVSQSMVASAGETVMLADLLRGASQQISTKVSSVACAASQVQVSIREISKNANDSRAVAKDAVDLAESAKDSMKKLETSSREIHKVNKVINSIAQQTNLLALNATIEAARAGDAGKGFAVVANEVKELAKQTARATEEIGQTIEALQSGTREAASAFVQIGTTIGSINDIFHSIASAVEEQTVTTNEIGRSVSDAAQKIGEITTNIGGVAASAKQTTQCAEDTRKASLELSRLASRLRASLNGASV
jgi:methyl-accepting chemotaxis protein